MNNPSPLPRAARALCATLVLLTAFTLLPLQSLHGFTPRTLPQQEPAPGAVPDATMTRRIFFPVANRGVPVAIARMELTQAVQNAAQSVPMVQDRPTAVRITLQAPTPTSGLTLLLAGTRNGAPLPGSPLRRTAVTAVAKPAPGSAQATFLLPASWLSGSIRLQASVLAAGDPKPSVTRSQQVSFRPVAPLVVTVVPVRYVHAPTGQSYAAGTSFGFHTSVQAMFPLPRVNIRVRTPVTFRGDLTADDGSVDGNEWGRFYDQIAALKQADGAPFQTVYVGILPTSATQGHRFYIAGLGGSIRVAVGLDLELVMAHELGHTLGRVHAPCGGVSGADPAYPYPNAAIGAYGYDTARGVVYDPSSTTDLMSYCKEWISDYTYAGMLNDQVTVAGTDSSAEAVAAATAMTGPSLLVRALLPAAGGSMGEIQPAYRLDATPDSLPAQSSVAVALFGSAGEPLGEWPVAVDAMQEYDLVVRLVSVRLPLPQAPVARIEVREQGVVVATRDLQPLRAADAGPVAPATAVVEGDALVVRNPSGEPLMVRLRQPSGWTTLTMDLRDAEWRVPLADLPGGDALVDLAPADMAAADPAGATVMPAGAAMLSLPNRAPFLEVNAGAGPAGETVVVSALASDPEDGTLTDVIWRVNGAVVNQGPLFQLELGAEPLLIEAQVSDSAGLMATASTLLQPIQTAPAGP